MARHPPSETPGDLARHDLIGPDRTLADLELVATCFTELDRGRFVVRTDSHPAQLAATRAGSGIAVVQRPIDLADPVLRLVLPDFTPGQLDTWIVIHENLRELPRVRGTFDCLAEAFRRYGR